MGRDVERFRTGVHFGEADQCWEWQRCRTRDGYGTLDFDGRRDKAHRVAWILANGPIPNGLCVLHTCDNPPCCNPAHLWLGTRTDNNADKVAKRRDRHLEGENHGSARLTQAQVDEIREVYTAGGITQPTLGARYGVSRQTISAIVRGERWQTPGLFSPGENTISPPYG